MRLGELAQPALRAIRRHAGTSTTERLSFSAIGLRSVGEGLVAVALVFHVLATTGSLSWGAGALAALWIPPVLLPALRLRWPLGAGAAALGAAALVPLPARGTSLALAGLLGVASALAPHGAPSVRSVEARLMGIGLGLMAGGALTAASPAWGFGLAAAVLAGAAWLETDLVADADGSAPVGAGMVRSLRVAVVTPRVGIPSLQIAATGVVLGALVLLLGPATTEVQSRVALSVGALAVATFAFGFVLTTPFAQPLAAARHPGGATGAGVAIAALALLVSPTATAAAVFFPLALLAGAGLGLVGASAIAALSRGAVHDTTLPVLRQAPHLLLAAAAAGAVGAGEVADAIGFAWSLSIAALALVATSLVTIPRLNRIGDEAARVIPDLGEKIELLSALKIFDGSPRESLEDLARSMESVDVESGQAVITEGTIPSYFFIAKQGTFDVLSSGEAGGEPTLVNQMHAGDYFGEIGLLEGMPGTATVRAGDGCSLYRVRGADFLAAVDASPGLSAVLLERIRGGLARTHPSYRPATEEGSDPGTSEAEVLPQVAALAAELGPALTPPGHAELLGSITAAARGLFGSAACSLALLDGDEEVEFKAASGAGADEVIGLRVPTTQGIVGWVVAHGETLMIPDVGKDPRFAVDVAGDTGYTPTIVLAAPLSTRRRLVGVIEVLDPRVDGRLADLAEPLAAFAEQAALAIESAAVFSDLGRALFAAAAGATEGQSLSKALQRVARQAPRPSRALAELAAAFLPLAQMDDDTRAAALKTIRDSVTRPRKPATPKKK